MKKTNKILTAILMLVMVITMAHPIEASAATTRPVVKATQKVVSKGKKLSLKATYNGRNVTKKATWKSSNKKVATVNKGVVTGKKAGTTYVTATYKKTSKKVKITVAEMKLNKTSVRLTVGQKYTLRATYNKKNVKPAFKTSNANVATVSKSGVVTAKKTGVAYITVRYKDCKINCKIVVAEKPHTHDYKPVYKTIHHKEEGHYEEQQVMVKEAWDEPVYESCYVCNGCEKAFGDSEYGNGNAAVAAWGQHSKEQRLQGNYNCKSYRTEKIQTDTIHHDAEYETQNVWIVDKPAWDEKVIDHYECSCGATK